MREFILTKLDKPVCELPADKGDCLGDDQLRWFYHPEEKRCKTFTYGGCNGNYNNFPSREKCMEQCGGILCGDGSSVGTCDDVCSSAVCETMPEAICVPDPCTCQPVFYHPDAGKQVQCGQEHSMCERMRLKAERTQLLTADNPDIIHVVQCEEDGAFSPLQCHKHHKVCWCVDAMGEEIQGSRRIIDGLEQDQRSPCAKSKIDSLQIELVFAENLDIIFDNLEDFKGTINQTLSQELGVSQDEIIHLSVSKTSKANNFDDQKFADFVKVVALVTNNNDLASAVDLLDVKIVTGQLHIDLKGTTIYARKPSMMKAYKTDEIEEAYEEFIGDDQKEEESRKDESENKDSVLIAAVCGTVALAVIILLLALIIKWKVFPKLKERPSVAFGNPGFNQPSESPDRFSVHYDEPLPTNPDSIHVEGVQEKNSKA